MTRTEKKAFLKSIRIKAPKYYCNGLVLNEYEARNIQLQVAKGLISVEDANALNITDSIGVRFDFRSDGRLKNNVKGYDISSMLVFGMIRIDRENKNVVI